MILFKADPDLVNLTLYQLHGKEEHLNKAIAETTKDTHPVYKRDLRELIKKERITDTLATDFTAGLSRDQAIKFRYRTAHEFYEAQLFKEAAAVLEPVIQDA